LHSDHQIPRYQADRQHKDDILLEFIETLYSESETLYSESDLKVADWKKFAERNRTAYNKEVETRSLEIDLMKKYNENKTKDDFEDRWSGSGRISLKNLKKCFNTPAYKLLLLERFKRSPLLYYYEKYVRKNCLTNLIKEFDKEGISKGWDIFMSQELVKFEEMSKTEFKVCFHMFEQERLEWEKVPQARQEAYTKAVLRTAPECKWPSVD